MKWIIRCAVVIVSIIGGVKSMPVIQVSSGDNVTTTIRYVALGDSIAYGYGLENREEDCYVGKICQYLESQYDSVMLTNFGENGMRSDELLDVLTNPKNEMYNKYRATLLYADVVTISIGSNDLLHFIKFDFNMEETIRKGEKKFRQACVDFQKNFPKIIKEIRNINPHVQIYANNIYNPARGIAFYTNVYDVAEEYINYLNVAFDKADGYYLVDIKKAFDDSEKSMINVSLNGREIDPHPSKEGHYLIGQLVNNKIKKTIPALQYDRTARHVN